MSVCSWRRCASVEYPVPKSSSAILTPSFASDSIARCASPSSPINTFSGISKLAAREVDSDRELLRAAIGARPGRALAARLVQDEVSDRSDESSSLSDRNEFGGGDDATLGVAPAHERLGAHHRAVLKVEHRLVEHE